MFSRAERPDALFVANDHMAVAVMDVARHEFGLRIPEDLSIVGYDDVGPARWTSYGITSMSQPLKRMVEATVDILMDQIASGEIEAEHRILNGRSHLRQTSQDRHRRNRRPQDLPTQRSVTRMPWAAAPHPCVSMHTNANVNERTFR
jgi:DNA-binding LacI/PurR family transcriptional regulator